MGYIFVLLLQENKYYIGLCNEPSDVRKYFVNYGPKWIRKYKPIKMVELISPCDIFDLDKHTKRYMAKYGLNNVRGGAYSSMFLSHSDKNHIDKEIFTALGMCMYCGSETHISMDCSHNNFSGKVRQVVISIKNKLGEWKTKINENVPPCIEKMKTKWKNRNNPNYKYNYKYDTLVLDKDEEEPILYVKDPKTVVKYEELSSEDEEMATFSSELDEKNINTISLSNSPKPPTPKQEVEEPQQPELLLDFFSDDENSIEDVDLDGI